MASVNDYGRTDTDWLSQPKLGGNDGWAAAVAAALDGSDTTVNARIAAAVRVTHPNTDDVLVQQWDATKSRWQTSHYDSGVRDVSSLLLNGWAAPTIAPQLRRVGQRVTLRFPYRLDGSASTSTVVLLLPTGFQYPADDAFYMLGSLMTDSHSGIPGKTYTNLIPAGISIGYPAGATSQHVQIPSTNLAITGELTWYTLDAIPTSLPGTLVTPAPA